MRLRFLGLLALAVLGAACAGANAGPAPGGNSALDPVQSLISTLGSHGATVQNKEAASEPFFAAPGRLLLVNGQEVRVFRFASESEATAVVGAISPDGYSVVASGGLTTISQVDWVAKPHFYRSGTLIILYVGDDAATRQLLSAVVGPAFAGGA